MGLIVIVFCKMMIHVVFKEVHQTHFESLYKHTNDKNCTGFQRKKIKVLNYFWGIIFGKTFLLLVICVSAISWMKRDHLALFTVYIFKTI